MTYEQLPVREFGKQLIATQDLDPVYSALVKCGLERDQLYRWLLSYWCFYHVGLASYLSEFSKPTEFWEVALTAAENIESAPGGLGRWPRGKERRHFRGALAMKTIRGLRAAYDLPQTMVSRCTINHTLGGVSNFVTSHYGFGPWIAFKAADMLERCAYCEISFNTGVVMMFDEPAKAAVMVYDQERPDDKTTPRKDRIQHVTEGLVSYFRDTLAPPTFDRPINIQEVETVLCKWKSHVHGKYALGTDTHEVRHAALLWAAVSPTAARFAKHVPEER